MKLSLRLKIVGLVLTPLLASIVYGAFYLNSHWQTFKEAQAITENGNLIQKNSELLHQMQLERAKNSLFLAGKIRQEELKSHIDVVDSKWRAVQEQVDKISSKERSQALLNEARDGLEKLRLSVSGKSVGAADATKEITGLISILIKLDVLVATDQSLNGVEMNFLSLTILEMAKEYGGRLRANLLNILAADNPISIQDVSRLEGLRSGISVNLDAPNLVVSGSARTQIEDFRKSATWVQVEQTYAKVINRATEGHFGEDPSQFYEAITSSLNALGTIVSTEVENVNKQAEDLRSHASRLFFFTLTLLLGIVILITIFGVIIIRNLTKSLHSVVEDLSQAAETMASGGLQLNTASQQVANGSVHSASALEEVVASMEEINSIVAQNEQKAQQAASISDEGFKAAENGKVQVVALVCAMEDISKSANKIEEIINVIEDIAFQTNLLALNAAVEAARAGEQGKSFAVVAEAVRALALRSSSAAKDITTLIKESSVKVQDGVHRATLSRESIDRIVKIISDVSQINTEIANASSEQAAGIQQISKAMIELDSSTQQNAAAAEEVSAFAGQMRQQTDNIENLATNLTGLVDGERVIHDRHHILRNESLITSIKEQRS
ncbi:methyl-accepting chemotaxis protein [Bdellovibrio bacteriovorus]|uniref:methyl-accepting chemotaxis protein n=1 Tax=Bdellovibrio TaxID=958 RepID=UPI0035A847FE